MARDDSSSKRENDNENKKEKEGKEKKIERMRYIGHFAATSRS